jgi:hypothetical protein
VKFQDAGSKVPDPLPPGAVIFYHTHGVRQYFGTCKLHKDPNCRHLVHWEPGHVARGAWPKNITPEQKKKYQLGKTLMREWAEREIDVPMAQRCGTCWNKKTGKEIP